MSTVKKFEDLAIWQISRKLVNRIYQISTPCKFNNDYKLIDQIRRASVSVMTNISEGFGRFSNREFIRFLEISASSCNELKSLLYVAEDLEYIDFETRKEVFKSINEVRCKTLALISYLHSNHDRRKKS